MGILSDEVVEVFNKVAEVKQCLYDKLEKEYQGFINELIKLTPEEIIDKSYEKVMKEELKDMFYPDNNYYDIRDLRGLIKADKPLEELYLGWMDFDGGIHEQLKYSVDDTLEFLNKQQKNKNKEQER